MTWRVEVLDEAKAALAAMPVDIRAGELRPHRPFDRGARPERVREPYVRHLEGRLWEMRMKGKDGIARAVYVSATGHRAVVVHVFVKKTEKTPRREMETAKRRARDIR